MFDIDNIFAVIVLTKNNQRALDRAVRIAKIANAKVHVCVCIYSKTETNNPETLIEAETARYTM